MKKVTKLAFAGLIVLAMAGVSNAGVITEQAAGEQLENAKRNAFSRRNTSTTTCPLTPGVKAYMVRRQGNKIQLLLRSGKYRNCIGWTTLKNYRR